MDIVQDLSTMRAFCADAMGCNVPVHFLSKNHHQSFQWALSYAKNILTGPNMASWLPRFPVEPRGYQVLCSISGIGDVAAKGLLRAYGGIGQIANEAKFNPNALAACKVNGKALGKAKAAKIAEVLG
jgi:DNA integrity scanning protein DisA with diadenylate cyclase activity